MLEQTFTFTIPSLYDDTLLDCRIYHPNQQSSCGLNAAKPWRPRGAIIAHPYTSMGGSYDDYVILSAVAEIVKLGIVVGTFNFRGAGSSKGKASWTAKPELSDYVSFVGFFLQYLDGIIPSPSIEPSLVFTEDSSTLSPIPSAQGISSLSVETDRQRITIVLGGYSYGSLLASHLPAVDQILERYAKIDIGTTEAEIRLRALTLSTQWNKEAHNHCVAERGRSLKTHNPTGSPSRSLGTVFGGEESVPGSRRSSRDSKRSLDFIRRSVDRSKRKLDSRSVDNGINAECREPLDLSRRPEVQACYLLISPLLPPISHFATMFSRFRYASADKDNILSSHGKCQPSASLDEPLVNHQTLAIFGNRDFFNSSKKLRRWAEDLAEKPNSLFRFKEIRGAGHFWQEEGVDIQMRACIKEWLTDFICSQDG